MPQMQIPSCCLSPEQKEILIGAVRARPAIWDSSSDEYNDSSMRRNAYVEVAEILSVGGSHYRPAEIQIEWKKLRDVFNRTLKKVTASGSLSDVCWRYWDKMQFIASPDQLSVLGRNHENDQKVDLFGIQQFIENSAREFTEEMKEDVSDSRSINLDWIATRCKNDEAESPNDGESSSPFGDEEDPSNRTLSDNGNLESPTPKKRRYIRRLGIPNPKPTELRTSDPFDAFGAFVASNLRMVSQRNKATGAMMKREILELLIKYEMDNL